MLVMKGAVQMSSVVWGAELDSCSRGTMKQGV